MGNVIQLYRSPEPPKKRKPIINVASLIREIICFYCPQVLSQKKWTKKNLSTFFTGLNFTDLQQDLMQIK